MRKVQLILLIISIVIGCKEKSTNPRPYQLPHILRSQAGDTWAIQTMWDNDDESRVGEGSNGFCRTVPHFRYWGTVSGGEHYWISAGDWTDNYDLYCNNCIHNSSGIDTIDYTDWVPSILLFSDSLSAYKFMVRMDAKHRVSDSLHNLAINRRVFK